MSIVRDGSRASTSVVLCAYVVILLANIALVSSFTHFRHISQYFGHSKSLLHLQGDGSPAPGPTIKLPIVQILKKSNLEAEFICGNDMEGSVQKLSAFVASISKSTEGRTNSEPGYVSNMYSDGQLLSTLTDLDPTKTVILKIFRTGCKKCAVLDPIFSSLCEDSTNEKIEWCQAEVGNIPEYASHMKRRLSGALPSIDPWAAADCATCGNTGFVQCTDCSGEGHIIRGSLAVTCPTCVGYKKVRCPTCGGKCMKCETA
jgi:hypothetical protein